MSQNSLIQHDVKESSTIQPDVDIISNELESLTLDSNMQTKTCKSGTQTEELHYLFHKCLCKAPFDVDDMQKNNKVWFYTGLVEASILQILFKHISPYVVHKSQSLMKFQELVMVLIKLRLNVPFQDLAYHFGVSVLTFSRTFTSWIRVMDSRLLRLIYWPEQKELWNTLPKRFLFSFGNRTVIIDCFEIFIEHPTDLLARAQTF